MELNKGFTYPEENLYAPINYHNITHDDMVNGEGLRVVLWVAGCPHHCMGCQNPVTWDEDGGIPFTKWDEAEFYEWLSKPWTQGATFSGGDPLHPKNREKIGEMIREINSGYPSKDIWLYTGYRLTGDFQLSSQDGHSFIFPELGGIDILVDGMFDAGCRENDIAHGRKVLWRGSSNQRVIDIKASMDVGKIVEKF